MVIPCFGNKMVYLHTYHEYYVFFLDTHHGNATLSDMYHFNTIFYLDIYHGFWTHIMVIHEYHEVWTCTMVIPWYFGDVAWSNLAF